LLTALFISSLSDRPNLWSHSGSIATWRTSVFSQAALLAVTGDGSRRSASVADRRTPSRLDWNRTLKTLNDLERPGMEGHIGMAQQSVF
jgi:hypothetical protein